MTLDTISLQDALKLLTLPRVVGTDPESGDEITAQNGRYGPYLKKGTDSRSIDSEDKLLTITLEEALKIYAEPKRRGRAAADPGREVGKDPETGATVTVKSGRFGPYVTDGEYNATLRQGDDESSITIERAAELLAERRAKGPAKKAAKKGAKKSAKKTTKKTAKKTPSKTAKKS
jgi:DNA topoisomerase-1